MEEHMSEFNVRLERLAKLRVASLHGFGTQPELQAWDKLAEFAGNRGYLNDLSHHRIFGFNNPDPTPGSPNYGYELWITVDPEVSAEGEVEIKEFPGGLYAVARCDATGNPYEVIPAAWQQLVVWREQSTYQPGSQQWLEEHIPAEGKGLVETAGGAWVLDLYLPLSQ
jgi:DNA gyrase inhibitor GyrI